MSELEGIVSPRSLVPGAKSAPSRVSNMAIRVHFPAQVRGPCRFARVLPRGDGVGPTKKRTQNAYIFRQTSFSKYRCLGWGAAVRGELCAWSVCQSLHGWLGVSMFDVLARPIIFLMLTVCWILLQVLSRMQGQLSLLCPLLKSED